MTYNFDAERWFEDRRALLESRLARGELGKETFAAELEALERRYEAMLARLDGMYRIPGLE